jgi:hypothetical protein
MMRTTQAIAAICAVLVLASCGKDEGEPIPESRATRLESLLQQVQRQSDNGSCVTLLKTTIPALEAQAERLPSSVGSDTQETITDGVAHLRDLAETDCAEQQQDELPTTTESTDTEPSTTEETTPSTESTDTEPSTSTETTPPETTTPETTTPETTPPDTPPDNPPGNGGTPPGQGKKGNKKADQVGGIEP